MSKKAIFEKKNILVTGGAGFLGSHLCDELVKKNKVICLDNFSTGDEKNIDHLLSNPDFEFIKHDITEPIDLEALPEMEKFKLKFQGIQEIYHLACPTSPKNFNQNMMETMLANSFGIKHALDLAVNYNAKFMQFSSSVVYGPRREDAGKIHEGDLGLVDFLSARSSYDEGKRFAETITKNYREIKKIDAKIVRVFRTYGPRMKLNDGQMIPDFIFNALDNADLVIHGDENFSTCLCYVSDVIDGVLKLMDSDLFGPFNLGSDVSVNIKDVADKIIALLESRSKIIHSEELLFLSPLCIPDIAKAKQELGWLPVVTLDNGLQKTIDDLRANKGLVDVSTIIDI
jgi:UDP-glucuronate decarboxylase